jgi:hypothetical protein
MKSEVTIASILLLLPGFLAAQLVNQQPFGPRSAPESQARALETTAE